MAQWGDTARDPLAYAYSCVRNAAIDRIRTDIRRRKREELTPLADAFDPEFDADDGRDHLLATLDGLGPDHREVLIMRIWGDMAFPAIAEALDANVNTITSRYRAALTALRSRLDPEDL